MVFIQHAKISFILNKLSITDNSLFYLILLGGLEIKYFTCKSSQKSIL